MRQRRAIAEQARADHDAIGPRAPDSDRVHGRVHAAAAPCRQRPSSRAHQGRCRLAGCHPVGVEREVGHLRVQRRTCRGEVAQDGFTVIALQQGPGASRARRCSWSATLTCRYTTNPRRHALAIIGIQHRAPPVEMTWPSRASSSASASRSRARNPASPSHSKIVPTAAPCAARCRDRRRRRPAPGSCQGVRPIEVLPAPIGRPAPGWARDSLPNASSGDRLATRIEPDRALCDGRASVRNACG